MNQFILLVLLFFTEHIIAHGPPTLLPDTTNFNTFDINENDPIELQCPVTNSPDLSIQWSKNNEDLDPMWSSSSNLVIKRFLLKIRQAHLTDAGLYKCDVVNGFGSIQVQFRINIKSDGAISTNVDNNEPQNVMPWEADSLHGEPPEFVSRSDDDQTGPTKVIQPEGTTVRLKCLASGKPLLEIRWKKNGKILSEDEYGVTQSQILIIKNLRQSDAGVTSSTNLNNHLLYVIIVALCVLVVILFFLFCYRHRRRKTNHHHSQHSHSTDGIKFSIKPRQPLTHHNGPMVPSTTARTSNNYIANTVDSVPITRQYQQQRPIPTLSSDLTSPAKSSLYYARVQAF
ncbi:unnamed protein product [Adineta steineri]|uniref:Ig-like domain-containing protein n=1 Tax=Adineta steineri TaxID=433720 RepID=A0A815N7Y4_9BILA|nr:unnamed protein product [Adineta steineri]CAF1624138.1 unnamed protein product [Adineta steineri]